MLIVQSRQCFVQFLTKPTNFTDPELVCSYRDDWNRPQADSVHKGSDTSHTQDWWVAVRASKQLSVHNLLLLRLPAADLRSLAPRLEAVDLKRGQVLFQAGEPIEFVYFLDTGIASVVAKRADGRQIEAGLYGREGMGGICLLLGSDRSPHQHFMQVAGAGHRMLADDFRRLVRKSPAVNDMLLRFVHVFITQTAQTAAANGSAMTGVRLARWLLMCHDRMSGSDLQLTHDFLAIMLGVRRPVVTEAIHDLEGNGYISATRGKITVLSRAGLERVAGATYGLPEAEYRRLLGPLL